MKKELVTKKEGPPEHDTKSGDPNIMVYRSRFLAVSID
jgi:hypothetical protein